MRCQPLLPLNGGLRFGHQKGDQHLKQLATICAYCGIKFDKCIEKTTDHIIPRARHGISNIDNYLICCEHCNNLKGSKSLGAFLAMRPDVKGHIRAYLNSFHDSWGMAYVERISNTIRHCAKGVV